MGSPVVRKRSRLFDFEIAPSHFARGRCDRRRDGFPDFQLTEDRGTPGRERFFIRGARGHLSTDEEKEDAVPEIEIYCQCPYCGLGLPRDPTVPCPVCDSDRPDDEDRSLLHRLFQIFVEAARQLHRGE